MKIVRSAEEIEQMWVRANRADQGNEHDYAGGAYDMIQWLTGNGDEPDLED